MTLTQCLRLTGNLIFPLAAVRRRAHTTRPAPRPPRELFTPSPAAETRTARSPLDGQSDAGGIRRNVFDIEVRHVPPYFRVFATPLLSRPHLVLYTGPVSRSLQSAGQQHAVSYNRSAACANRADDENNLSQYNGRISGLLKNSPVSKGQ